MGCGQSARCKTKSTHSKIFHFILFFLVLWLVSQSFQLKINVDLPSWVLHRALVIYQRMKYYELIHFYIICGNRSQIYSMSVRSKPNHLVSQRGSWYSPMCFPEVRPLHLTHWLKSDVLLYKSGDERFDIVWQRYQISWITQRTKRGPSWLLTWCIMNYLSLSQLFTHKNNWWIATKTGLWHWQSHNSNYDTLKWT